MSDGQQLRPIERWSYGFGDMGTSLAYNMASGFLLYYYVNVIGLPAAAVGVIFLVARLMDAVIDLLVGVAVDRTNSRRGRARPYFLFTAIPYAICTVLVFTVPDSWGQTAQLVYAFLTFKLLGILLSFGAIPYTALLPMMTKRTDDRLKLSGARAVGTSVGVVLATAGTMPLVGWLGQGDEARGFMMTAILFAIVGLLAMLSLYKNCQERTTTEAPPRFDILPVVWEMLRNQAWVVAFLFTFFYFVRFGAMMAETAYLAIDVLGRPWMISVMLPAVSGMLLLSAFAAPPLFAKVGIRRGCLGIMVISAILFLLLPLFEQDPVVFLGIYFVACFVTSMTITAAFTMIAGTVDWHEHLFGRRNEGILSAGVSLSTKLGMALGAAGVAFVLSAVGYDPDAVTDEARDAIRWSYYGGAALMLALQGAAVWFWPMDKEVGETE